MERSPFGMHYQVPSGDDSFALSFNVFISLFLRNFNISRTPFLFVVDPPYWPIFSFGLRAFQIYCLKLSHHEYFLYFILLFIYGYLFKLSLHLVLCILRLWGHILMFPDGKCVAPCSRRTLIHTHSSNVVSLSPLICHSYFFTRNPNSPVPPFLLFCPFPSL